MRVGEVCLIFKVPESEMSRLPIYSTSRPKQKIRLNTYITRDFQLRTSYTCAAAAVFLRGVIQHAGKRDAAAGGAHVSRKPFRSRGAGEIGRAFVLCNVFRTEFRPFAVVSERKGKHGRRTSESVLPRISP